MVRVKSAKFFKVRQEKKRLTRKELDDFFRRDAPKVEQLVISSIEFLKMNGIQTVVTRSQYAKLKAQVSEVAVELYFKGLLDSIRPMEDIVQGVCRTRSVLRAVQH